MWHYLLEPLIGIVALLLYLVNLSFWFSWLLFIGLLRGLPYAPWRRVMRRVMEQLPVYWIRINTLIQQLTIPKTHWHVWVKSGAQLRELSPKVWYLLVCNHQSWTDILVLQHVFNQRIPPLKFFLKKQLLWTLPIASWACWLLGFPFMQRPTRAQLLKNPEQGHKNLEVARKACEQYQTTPTTVANFVEGTRFTAAKHQYQQPPYQHLLWPSAGGIAFSLAALGGYFDTMLNVTIIYGQKSMSLWDFLCGRIQQIEVYVETIPITTDLIGDYRNNRVFRLHFQKWLNQLWQQKDQIIQARQLGTTKKILDSEWRPLYQSQLGMLCLKKLDSDKISQKMLSRKQFTINGVKAMCRSGWASLVMLVAVILGMVDYFGQPTYVHIMVAISRFFDIVLPTLATAALIKYLYSQPAGQSRCQDKTQQPLSIMQENQGEAK